ncbi:hypothetical protein ACTU3I_09550 [Microbacterium sp. RD1]|uniref:hypothetical protein n=1 Tax=Microbacterium sp. RD1 TaxID=3457313 RepID=UPI003FA5D425
MSQTRQHDDDDARADAAPPTDAVSDEVKSDAADVRPVDGEALASEITADAHERGDR